ncbi:hypothetical protein JCGZ_08880 [Jatropha curcas]|uniref:Uncharacterized protein n=1 Tax=Jatropha curcas TaxID=180498 RepID=A0A067KKG4_JATCU|nr:hypothetical protein JCGZ_08880 [Jatropha curcas]
MGLFKADRASTSSSGAIARHCRSSLSLAVLLSLCPGEHRRQEQRLNVSVVPQLSCSSSAPPTTRSRSVAPAIAPPATPPPDRATTATQPLMRRPQVVQPLLARVVSIRHA